MRKFLFVLFFILITASLFANINDSLLVELDRYIDKRDFYVRQKIERIDSLKDQLYLSRMRNEKREAFKYLRCLTEEYESFVFDSAFFYVTKLKEAALQISEVELLAEAKIKEGFIFISGGLFKEAIDSLKSMQPETFSDSLKRKYYPVLARAYYDLADYNDKELFFDSYLSIGNKYLDSALIYTAENTNIYWSVESLRRMKKHDWRGAKFAFEYWMRNLDVPASYYGIATSSLGYIYQLTGYEDKAVEYLAKAAIADIKRSTKETVALRNLANILFENGQVSRAYKYIIIALDDATYHNARHRKIEIARVLPIIEGEKLAQTEAQKEKLIVFLVGLVFLIVLVVASLVVIYIQLKKLYKIRKVLQQTVMELNELNKSLTEANQIKEEYIGYFFSINSEYIEKLVGFHKNVHRKVLARQYDELTQLLKRFNMKEERRSLFRKFDEIFLKIFPDFLEYFKALFDGDEEFFVPKKGDLLSAEMRIFALNRLGITDAEKIASFLDLSVNTIYTYKTKVKSKSLFRDSFDEKIMEIKAL
jgi:tetratricopeptide (TPR) repeat protein